MPRSWGSNHFGNGILNWFGLTRLAPALRTVLVEMACNPLTTGLSHLINLGSPFLNSSKAWDCSWNIARIESGDSHPWMAVASGWLQRSCPVRLAYLAKAMSKRVLKLDCGEGVYEASDMVKWEGFGRCMWKEENKGDSRVRPYTSSLCPSHPVSGGHREPGFRRSELQEFSRSL